MFLFDTRVNALKKQMNLAASAVDDAKNVAVLAPLSTPVFYKQAMIDSKPAIQTAGPGGATQAYTLLRRIDDTKTGFNAAAYLDQKTGHAVLVFRGTNFPWIHKGSSLLDFWKDFVAVRAADEGRPGSQLPQAEQAYLDLMKDPSVKSVELVGHSLGTVYVNYLAAKYGARGTAIADLGLSKNFLAATFNKSALPEAYRNLRERTVDLVLKDDLIVKFFGASRHRGRQIDLDTGQTSDLDGIVHFASAYLRKAEDLSGPPVKPA